MNEWMNEWIHAHVKLMFRHIHNKNEMEVTSLPVWNPNITDTYSSSPSSQILLHAFLLWLLCCFILCILCHLFFFFWIHISSHILKIAIYNLCCLLVNAMYRYMLLSSEDSNLHMLLTFEDSNLRMLLSSGYGNLYLLLSSEDSNLRMVLSSENCNLPISCIVLSSEDST